MQDGMLLNLTDEEGGSYEVEVVGELGVNGEDYVVFLPADMDETDPDYGLIILHSVEENGEETFESVDDEDLLNTLYEIYMARLMEDEDDDDEYESDEDENENEEEDSD